MKIADALEVKLYRAGENIITEGEVGTDFYIVEEGEADAFKGESVVLSYGPSSYFGELALLQHGPRAATVKARTDCKVLVISAEVFTRLCGKLSELMSERASVMYK
jgi:cAMP-dependent protein kinase regulator